jgi:hypothetical protein
VTLCSATAHAEEWTRRSYILPDGSFELTGTPARPRMVTLNLSEDAALEPITIHPHFYFGVTEGLTLGITHDRGICLNDGCWAPDGEEHVYNDAGFDLLYGLAGSERYEIDLHVGAPVVFFDPFWTGVNAGVLGRVNLGDVVSLVFDPALYVGFTNRDEGNRESLWLPFWFYFQATETVVPFVGSGFYGPLDGFGDRHAIPLEGGVVFAASENVDLGFVFAFPNLLGRGGRTVWRNVGFMGRFRF